MKGYKSKDAIENADEDILFYFYEKKHPVPEPSLAGGEGVETSLFTLIRLPRFKIGVSKL